MNYKQLLQRALNTIDALIIPAIMSTYHKGANMTTWAIQPSHFGNEVKIWADVFHADHFSEAKRQAERQAELLGEPITIWKVCLLYTSPSPRDKRQSRMPSSA